MLQWGAFPARGASSYNLRRRREGTSEVMANTAITVARGDGIGPEIMDATLRILEGAGARLDIEEIEIGEKVYLAGNPTKANGESSSPNINQAISAVNGGVR